MRVLALSIVALLGLSFTFYAWVTTSDLHDDRDSRMFLEISVDDDFIETPSDDLTYIEPSSIQDAEIPGEVAEEEIAEYYELERNMIRNEDEDLGKELNFLVIGDFGYVDEPVTKDLARLMYDKVKKTFIQYDFIMSVGDNVYNKGVESITDPKPKQLFQDIFKIDEVGLDWYSVVGNHDCSGNLKATFQLPRQIPKWKQDQPYYHKVFNIGSSDKKVAFIFLNGCDLACKNQFSTECFKAMHDNINWTGIQTQIDWIKDTLETVSKDPDVIWKVVVNHWAIFSAGSKHGDNENMKEILLPLLSQYKVDMVLSGHDHNLQYLRMNSEDGQIKNTTQAPEAPKEEKGVIGELLAKNLNKTIPSTEVKEVKENSQKSNETDVGCPFEIDYTYCSLDEYFHSEMTKCGIVKKDEQMKPLQSIYHGDALHMMSLYDAKFSRESISNQYDFLHQFVIGGGGPDLEKVCPLKHLRSLGKLRYSNSIPGIGEIKIKEDRIEAKIISKDDEILYTIKIFRNS